MLLSASHLRDFEEDSRSEVIFWIDEWSIELMSNGCGSVQARISFPCSAGGDTACLVGTIRGDAALGAHRRRGSLQVKVSMKESLVQPLHSVETRSLIISEAIDFEVTFVFPATSHFCTLRL